MHLIYGTDTVISALHTAELQLRGPSGRPSLTPLPDKDTPGLILSLHLSHTIWNYPASLFDAHSAWGQIQLPGCFHRS